MHSVVASLVFITLSIIMVSSIDYGHVDPGAARPVPPELASMFSNKSDMQLEMEECMKDYAQCMGTIAFRNVEICASNSFGHQQTFNNMCDMFYENCKGTVPTSTVLKNCIENLTMCVVCQTALGQRGGLRPKLSRNRGGPCPAVGQLLPTWGYFEDDACKTK